jgi:hypothetical protein
MANQGPESGSLYVEHFHNDGRGLERDFGANGAEMLASQTVVGQFRNTPSRTTTGQNAGQYRRGQPRQRSLCQQQNPTDNLLHEWGSSGLEEEHGKTRATKYERARPQNTVTKTSSAMAEKK